MYTICTRYRLSNHDIEDVGQNVWLLLVEQLGKLREPAALPGWLATTTARECLRVVTAASKAERLSTGLDDSVVFVDDTMIDEEILVAERNAALHAAFAWDASILHYFVREPFPSRTTGASLVAGRVEGAAPLTIMSEMAENGVIFSDGIESDYLEFNSGALATIGVAEKCGLLTV